MKKVAIAMAIVVGIAMAKGKAGELKPQPMNFSKLEPAKNFKPSGKTISTLEYANNLATEGRIEKNPFKLGLASITYFAISKQKPELRDYALTLLESATKIAKDLKYIPALTWLAEIWRSKTLGAGDPEKADQVIELANKLSKEPDATLGFGEKTMPSLLPPEYLRR